MRPGVLVVAKAPVEGEAKTRLAVDVGDRGAADLASAALLDTLAACEEAFPRGRRTLALTGDLRRARGASELARRLGDWDVFRQRGHDFGQRLRSAHEDAAGRLQAPVVQIGMDTPQVTGAQLAALAGTIGSGTCDAVLGPAADGGWWALAVVDPRIASGLADVPMSTPHTGAATYAMLRRSSIRVVRTHALTDIDTIAEARLVAHQFPDTRFAGAWQRLGRAGVSPNALFDQALAGAPCLVHGMPGGSAPLPVDSWRGGCDGADRVLVDACTGPSLDVGCGPGRFTQALAVRGSAALGIDVAAAAVRSTRARGAQAIRRNVFDPLPAEGRWESVLLADGNIGIGGDPVRLLRRVRGLLSQSGSAIVEVAAPGVGVATHRVHLEVDGRRSSAFDWAVVGADALEPLARQASLRALWILERQGRWFAGLGHEADAGRAS